MMSTEKLPGIPYKIQVKLARLNSNQVEFRYREWCERFEDPELNELMERFSLEAMKRMAETTPGLNFRIWKDASGAINFWVRGSADTTIPAAIIELILLWASLTRFDLSTMGLVLGICCAKAHQFLELKRKLMADPKLVEQVAQRLRADLDAVAKQFVAEEVSATREASDLTAAFRELINLVQLLEPQSQQKFFQELKCWMESKLAELKNRG